MARRPPVSFGAGLLPGHAFATSFVVLSGAEGIAAGCPGRRLPIWVVLRLVGEARRKYLELAKRAEANILKFKQGLKLRAVRDAEFRRRLGR